MIKSYLETAHEARTLGLKADKHSIHNRS